MDSNFDQHYRSAPFGFASHKIVLDSRGVPCDYQFLYVNPAFEKLTGLRADEITGKGVCTILPEIRNSSFNWIEKYGMIALGGEAEQFEQYSEPLKRWYQVHVYSTEKGYFNTVFTDSTETRFLNSELETIKKSLDQSTDAIGMVDLERETYYENQAFLTLFGPMGGRNIEDLYENKEVTRGMMEVILKGDVWDGPVRMYGRDGELKEISLRAYGIRNQQGEVKTLVGIHSDITEKSKVTRDLKEKSDYLESLLGTLPDHIYVMDHSGRFMDVIAGSTGELYLPKDEFIGKPYWEVLPDPLSGKIRKTLKIGRAHV